MNLVFKPNIPPSLLPIIRERILAVECLFPIWCQRIEIDWAIDEETYCTCSPQYAYRAVTLTVYPLFFEDPEWEQTLIHEIHHALLAPYTALVDRLLTKLLADDTVRELVNEQLAEVEEAVTEDLTIFAEMYRNKY